MELIAQGTANIFSGIFGGIPATGAIARTATNVRNGGRTPIAGIVHAAVLLLIMFFFGRWATLIPLACLAAILVVVAYNMSEWRSFKSLLRSPRSDVIVLLTTFLLTVIFDLTVAIEVGVVLAVFLFMRRMSSVTNVGVVTRELTDAEERDDPNAIDKRDVPEGVEVYEINGPFFFGAAYKFEEAMTVVERPARVRVIRMRDVPAMDSTGLHVLEQVHENCRKQGVTLIISEIHAQPLAALDHSGLMMKIGEENISATIDIALERAREMLGTG
jgi:SulP family sulfate permease